MPKLVALLVALALLGACHVPLHVQHLNPRLAKPAQTPSVTRCLPVFGTLFDQPPVALDPMSARRPETPWPCQAHAALPFWRTDGTRLE